jgi:glycine cleavage system regulatory protein
MLTTVVFTVFGADRPGLVEAVSTRVTANGGNWLESRLLHLGGHFAGIVRLEVEETQREPLLAALAGLDREGLKIVVHEAGAPAAAATPVAPAPGGRAITLEVVGHDRPGIVREIARALAARGVNVEDLATERTSAPMSGEPMFTARAEVLLPAGLDPAALRRDLEEIAADLMVDLTFHATA